MSRSVTCHGCGKRLEAADDYPRNKLRCPDCGVYCPLPPAETPPPAKRKEAEPAAATRPEPERGPAPPTASPPKPARRQRPKQVAADDGGLLTCSFCGERIRPRKKRDGSLVCASCGMNMDELPAADVPANPVALVPEVPEFAGTQEDDGNPYGFTSSGRFKCPKCLQLLEPAAVLCPGCGLNLKTGEKPVRVYEPYRGQWIPGFPPAVRLPLFLGCIGVFFVVGLIVSIAQGSPLLFLFPWLYFVALCAFLMGTYDQVDLSRNRKGKVELNKTWRVCFFRRPTQRIRLAEYEGVATGVDSEHGCLEWAIFVILLISGILPGILWWYFAIHRVVYHVALTRDYGFPELMLFRTRNREQKESLAEALQEVAGLPGV